MKTGFLFHEQYFWYDTGSAVISAPTGGFLQPMSHVESPESKRRIKNLIEASGLSEYLVPLQPKPATEEDILRYHTLPYIESLKAVSEHGGPIGDETYCGRGSFDVALLAVGGAITALDSILNGQVKNVYALVRPAGHHAEPDKAKGYCLLGNGVIAVLVAKNKWGVGKVAVIDWDVHHGNSAEHAFYSRADVLTISIHQDGCYPADSGAVEDNGEGDGKGFNINIPLPPGSGIGAYVHTFEQVIVPALKEYKPELIIVSSGLDASAFDPMARMMLPSSAYRWMTSEIKKIADEVCEGKLAIVHEGGYSEAYAPFCGLAVVEALCGVDTVVEDPFDEMIRQWPYQSVQKKQKQIIAKAASMLWIN